MEVLDLEERGPDLYVGTTPTTRLQRIFGGQVAAQALSAAQATVPVDRPAHSLHSYFLRPGDPHEEIRYEVDRIREGRTFSTRRVVARQTRGGDDVAIFALTADFTVGERAVAEHSLPMPEVPGPDGLPGIAEVQAAHPEKAAEMLPMAKVVEQRYLADPFDPEPRLPPDTAARGWFRVAGRLPDDDRVHAAALTFASDLTLLAAGLARVGGGWGGGAGGARPGHAVWVPPPLRGAGGVPYPTPS